MNLMADGEEVICVGFCRGLAQGENITAQGEYVDHPSYGVQFKLSSYRVVVPEDGAGMERYLGSGAIKGIGPALASRIVKKFGDDTFRVIEEEPERLTEIRGISERPGKLLFRWRRNGICGMQWCICRNSGSPIHWQSRYMIPTVQTCMGL